MFLATVTTKLRSIAPYSQSKKIQSERDRKETHADHEKRCWRERLHQNEKGEVYIPPMALKNCLAECAKFMSVQIPGRGKSTYTKHFEAGLLVTDPIMLGIQADQVEGEWLFVPADGNRGGGKRVDKCFPLLPSWEGLFTCFVLDQTITKDVFDLHLREAGRFIGLGRFRPRNAGFYGRFQVDDLTWNVEE